MLTSNENNATVVEKPSGRLARVSDTEPSITEQSIIESMTIPGALFDAEEGYLLIQNDGFRALTPNITLPLTLTSFYADLTLLKDPIQLGSSTNSGKPWETDYPLSVMSRTSERYFTLNVAKYLIDSQPRILLFIEDSTAQYVARKQRQAIHEQLLQTARSLSVGEMTTVLAHELNQPLGAIDNYLSTALKLAREDTNKEKVSEAIRRAIEQTKQATETIKHIREFVHAREPNFVQCSPLSLLERPLSLLQLELSSQHIEIELDILAHPFCLDVDKIMIEQVLINLIRNAIDAMELTPISQRKIAITAHQDRDGRMDLRITDNGSGIPEKYRHKVFNPFFSTKNEGMGAGLAICRSIIELHGGRLYYENPPSAGKDKDERTSSQDSGSTFVCILPGIVL